MKFKVVILCWFLSATFAAAQPHFSFFEPVQPPRKVQLMAQRGLHTLGPENSLEAVLACAGDFIEWAKVDVNLTRDGKHILLHDETVDRMTYGQGKVTEFLLEDLLKLDAGSPFARRFAGNKLVTLPELLKEAKGKVNLCLDCKRMDPTLLVREIRDAEMENRVIVYANLDLITQVKALSGGKIPVMIRFRPKDMEFESFIREVAPAAVEINGDQITAQLCKVFHEKGIKVQAKVLGQAWDNPKVWREVIEAGVDWLLTDDPVALRFLEVLMRIPNFGVKIAYHRGASRYAPENTIPSIQRAVAAGADFIEIDIRTTRDGKLILLHDSKLDRTTNGKGLVRDHELESIKKLNAGEWFSRSIFGKVIIPTLDEALAAYGETSNAYLDAKDIAPEALIEAIKKHKMLDRHVVYQSADYCRRIRELEPAIRTIPGLKNPEDLPKMVAIKAHGIDAYWGILSKEFIKKCHDHDIKVFSDALGFNETLTQYRRAMNWGIDVIQTDFPLRVLRAIELESKPPQR